MEVLNVYEKTRNGENEKQQTKQQNCIQNKNVLKARGLHNTECFRCKAEKG